MLKLDNKLRDLLVVLLKSFRTDEISLELTIKGTISALNELEEIPEPKPEPKVEKYKNK